MSNNNDITDALRYALGPKRSKKLTFRELMKK